MALLSVHLLLLVVISQRYSPVVCELLHVPAGLSHLELGHFDDYRVHPPLVRLVAALVVELADPARDWTRIDRAPHSRSELDVGRDFLLANGSDSFRLFSLARLGVIPFSLWGAMIVRRWSTELYGARAGLLSQLMWCFSPTILGYGALVTADVAAATLALATCFYFRNWLHKAQWSPAVVVGLLLGLAQLTKTTLLLLYPLLVVTWLGTSLWRKSRVIPIAPQWLQLTGMFFISVIVLNLGYGFEGTGRCYSRYRFQSDLFSGNIRPEGCVARWRRAAGSWMAEFPIPLPKNYVQGIDTQRLDFEMTKRSYLGGQWKNGGWWYFYLYALALKTPMGAWGLLVLATVWRWTKKNVWRPPCADSWLCVFAGAFLAFVSSQTGFSIHFRYVTPVIPFVLIWASQSARCMSQGTLGRMAQGLAVWLVGSSLYVYPHSFSYFNECAGGPSRGSSHLVGSSISWGQDVLYVRRWLEEQLPSGPVYLATLSYLDPQLAGIDFRLAPPLARHGGRSVAAPGWHIVDVNFLAGTWEPAADGQGGETVPVTRLRDYSAYQDLVPVASIGYSMKVFFVPTLLSGRNRS